MRLFTQEVFNQQMTSADTGAGAGIVYSDPQYNALLGSAEKLVVQLIADTPSGTTPSVTVDLQHSNDNQNFLVRTGCATIISTGTIDTTKPFVLFGSDAAASIPMGGYARLKVTLGGSASPTAHVRIVCCGRAEQGGAG